MKMRSKGSLRPPKPLWERSKLPLILLGYVVLSEWSTPFPFYASMAARLAVVALILVVAREFHHARMEVDEEWVGRTKAVGDRARTYTAHMSKQSWLRVQRVVTWLIVAYAFGMVINSMTTRCNSAAQCAILAPRLAIENIPTFLQFAIMVSLTLFQLAIMFWAMVKVGSYKIVMPGTVPVTFADVWGQDEAKQKVMEQVKLLENSDEVEAAGGYMPKGLLLYGPPGVGKTYLAKASANYSSKPLILVPPGAFQAPQPLAAFVYTPTGAKKMGDISPGDLVLGRDGKPHRVIKVKDMGIQPVWRVTFDDGASTECASSHLWSAQNRWDRERPEPRWRTLSLDDILAKGLKTATGSHQWAFPICEPVEFETQDLPIHPYVLGVFLGDGCETNTATTPVLTVGDDLEILDRVENLLPDTCPMTRSPQVDCEGRAYVGGNTKALLTKAGIWGMKDLDKEVPTAYLLGSVKDRVELLRGLMDTDGGSSNGYSSFNSSSFQLAEDVIWLVRSLGGKANVNQRVRTSGFLPGSVDYQVHIALPYQEIFTLPRKIATRRERKHSLKRYLTDAELVGEERMACLAIESDDHLYLTDDFIVTHNTFIGINLLKVWTLFREVRKLARRYGGVIVFIDEIDSLGSRGGSVEDRAAPIPTPGCVPFTRHAVGEPHKIVIDGAGSGMGTLEAFLSAMDGMEEPRGFLNRILVFLGFKPLQPYEYKYLMIGATNMMNRLDPALLRAGRFGRKIHITYPKVEGRQRTYEGYLAKVTNNLTPKDIEWAARNHAKGTGAEIQDIVNEALLVTFRDERDNPGSIRFDDLVHAMVWTKFGESEGQFEREENRWNVAVHEAGHAVAFHLLSGHRQKIWFGSIEQRSGTGGMVVPTELDEDWLFTREEMFADIQVGLASRVAEQLILGTTTNGHGGDGQMVTETALKMVNYGHEQQIGQWSYDKDYMREQAESILKEALETCTTLLTEHIEDVRAVAEILRDKGTCTGDEIHQLLESRNPVPGDGIQ